MTRESKRLVAASIMLVLMVAYGISSVFFSRYHQNAQTIYAIVAGIKFLPFAVFFVLVLLQRCGKPVSDIAVVVTTLAFILVTGVVVEYIGVRYFECVSWIYGTESEYATFKISFLIGGIIVLAVTPFIPWCAKFGAMYVTFFTSMVAIVNLSLFLGLEYTSVELKDVFEMFAYAFLSNSFLGITRFSPEFKYDTEDDE